MKRILIAAYLIVAAVSSAKAEPFDLRGIRLGITIDEFKKAPVPSDHSYAETRVYCTEEEIPLAVSGFVSIQYPRGNLAKVGGRSCDFAVKSEPGDRSFDRVHWNIAGAFTQPVLGFISDPDQPSTYRLAAIEMTFNIGQWDKLFLAHQRKYGEPTDASEGVVQTPMGVKYPKITATWRNRDSSITLEQRYQKVNRMRIVYEHSGLMTVFRKRLIEADAKAAGKL